MKNETVPVPAGIEDGQTVRMNVGNKELFITFKVERSRYFKRDGADVHTDADISLSQAILGGTIRIQGVYEDQTIQIIPGTSSHYTVTLKTKGLKRVNSIGNGDHYVHLKISIPKKLTDKQKALIQVSRGRKYCEPRLICCFLRRTRSWRKTHLVRFLA